MIYLGLPEGTSFSARQLLELYAMVWLLDGTADDGLLRRLGLDAKSLAARLEGAPGWSLAAQNDPAAADADPVADAARLIVLSGHTGSRRMLALLARGALLDQLSMVQKAGELRDLATALGRLPQWVLDEAGAVPAVAPAESEAEGADLAASAAPADGAAADRYSTEPSESISDAMTRVQCELDGGAFGGAAACDGDQQTAVALARGG